MRKWRDKRQLLKECPRKQTASRVGVHKRERSQAQLKNKIRLMQHCKTRNGSAQCSQLPLLLPLAELSPAVATASIELAATMQNDCLERHDPKDVAELIFSTNPWRNSLQRSLSAPEFRTTPAQTSAAETGHTVPNGSAQRRKKNHKITTKRRSIGTVRFKTRHSQSNE